MPPIADPERLRRPITIDMAFTGMSFSGIPATTIVPSTFNSFRSSFQLMSEETR